MLDRFKVPLADQVHVSEAALRQTVAAIFEKCNLTPEDAAIGADVLVTTDLRGVESHGVSNMLRQYVRDYRAGKLDPRPGWKVVRQSPGTAVIDAERRLGVMATANVGGVLRTRTGRRNEDHGAGQCQERPLHRVIDGHRIRSRFVVLCLPCASRQFYQHANNKVQARLASGGRRSTIAAMQFRFPTSMLRTWNSDAEAATRYPTITATTTRIASRTFRAVGT
jgi:hypothetical protein